MKILQETEILKYVALFLCSPDQMLYQRRKREKVILESFARCTLAFISPVAVLHLKSILHFDTRWKLTPPLYQAVYSTQA